VEGAAGLKNIVLGTAGHIDHGKTVLIKALTGVDTDRLKEEKERGISIDLGFAFLDLPGEVRAGIVDVPGHERFIKNMLAGTCGIDAVLMVVAANEGVMPQTREHLSVIDMLRINRGVVAITKTDLVDAEWLELVTADVEELIGESVLKGAEILPVSGATGEGVDELVAALGRLAEAIPERTISGPVRLPVDRVFTVEGFGTVVTGTLWSGEIREGDRLVLLPGEQEVRVRSAEVHSQSVPQAVAGQRTAVSLHGLGKTGANRGEVLATPGAFAVTHMIDARVDLVADAPKPVKNRSRLRLHLGSSEILCRAVLLDGEVLPPGGSRLAQIRLEAPLVTTQGDRFVLRSYSPMRVIGGGLVLDPTPHKHRAREKGVLDRLKVLETGTPEDRVMEILSVSGGKGESPAGIARTMGIETEEASSLLANLAQQGRAQEITRKLWVDEGVLAAVSRTIVDTCEDFQKKNPVRWGISKEELRNRAGARIAPAVVEKALDRLVGDKTVFQKADRIRCGSEDLTLAPEKEQLRKQLTSVIKQGSFSPPLVADLKNQFPDLGGKPAEFLDTLVDLGDLVKISPTLYLDAGAVVEMKRLLLEFFGSTPKITVPEFKDLIQASRKYTIPILEYFDVTGVTQRVGDARVAGSALRSE
jgi:selenocysteine-specific elongation factor